MSFEGASARPAQALRRRKAYGAVVDCTAAQVGGGLTYARSILPPLGMQLRAVNPLLVCTHANRDELAAVWPHDIWPITPALPMRLAIQQSLGALFPRAVVLGTGNAAPIGPGRGRSVVLVQDTRFFGSSPVTPDSFHARMQKLTTHWSVHRCARAIAVSDSLRSAILETIPGSANKLSTSVSGAPLAVEPEAPAQRPGRPFVLTVANGSPHKRLDVVVAAWASAAVDDLDLVMMGAMSADLASELRTLAARAVGSLHLLGPQSHQPAVAWYLANAAALITASEREAYGLTPAEGAAYGCPLIVSDIPAHREVCGNRADFFTPGSVPELAEAIRRSPSRARPKAWTPDRSWDDTARDVAKILFEVAAA